MMEKLNNAAEKFGVLKIRIIRPCIENELPRLIDSRKQANQRAEEMRKGFPKATPRLSLKGL